ncbi:MAG: hypothetical protein C0501_13720 [Isosphaera sp.]|nr:hypothetical protein [Isosphaera sp.]
MRRVRGSGGYRRNPVRGGGGHRNVARPPDGCDDARRHEGLPMPADDPREPYTIPEPPRPAQPDTTPGVGAAGTPSGADATAPHEPAPTGTVVQHGMPTILRDPSWPAVPGYEIIGEIARGGMGVVYAARDLSLNREVAVKTVLLHLAGDPRFAAEFDREAKLTALLTHPGVPPVHALGVLADGRPFLAMKLIRGQTLADELKAADLTADRARLVGVFEAICHAVGYAHSRGIVHRDLKPQNVMVGSFGEVQVMDWGLAKVLGEGSGAVGPGELTPVPADGGHTRAGQVKGTPAYMPPEQALGAWDKVDARADVFALGGILCAVLTGRPPYAAGPVGEVLRRAAAGDMADALARLDGCGADAELVDLCKRCLAADPAGRPADGRAVAEAVAGYRAGVEGRARKAEADRAAAAAKAEEEANTRREVEARAAAEAAARRAAEAEVREQRKRRKVQLALAAAVGLLLVGGGAFAWWVQKTRADRAAAETEERLKADNARERIKELRALAEQLREEYRYGAAGNALRGAEELAEKFAPELSDVIAGERADFDFVRDLDGIRMRYWTRVAGPARRAQSEQEKASGEYRAAFAARGLDVLASPESVGDRVKASGVRAELLSALDDWAVLEPDPAAEARILAAARRANDNPRAAGYRDPAVWRSKEKLRALAAAADPAEMTPAAVVALAELMRRRDLDPLPLLRHALALRPRDFHLAFALGRTLEVEVWGAKESAGAYRTARAIRPEDPITHLNLGLALRDQGDRAGALVVLREAVRLAPDLPNAHLGLGLGLSEYGDVDGAIASYREAIRLNPAFANPHNALGLALRRKGDADGAAAAYREAIRLDPEFSYPRINLALLLRARGDLAAAAEQLEIAVRHDARSGVHTELSITYRLQRRYAEAVTSARDATRINPRDSDAQVALGHALLATGESARAAVAFERAAEFNPREYGHLLHEFARVPVAPPPREVRP